MSFYITDEEAKTYRLWKKSTEGKDKISAARQRKALRDLDDARADLKSLERLEAFAILMTAGAIVLVVAGVGLAWLTDNTVFMGLLLPSAGFLLIGAVFTLNQAWDRTNGVSRIDSRRREVRKAEREYEDAIMEGSDA